MTAATEVSATSQSLTPHQTWLRVRGPLLAVLVIVIAGVAFAAIRSGGQYGRLDPRSADPHGSRAVAELLKDRGVAVEIVTTLDEAAAETGPGTTLLVTSPNMLTAQQQRRLRTATADSPNRTVLIAPDGSSLSRLAPGVRTGSRGAVTARRPLCELPMARHAGSVDIGGIRYKTAAPGATACYPDRGLSTLLVLPGTGTGTGTGDSVLLGSPDLLQNDRLDQQGNASLALQLLGSRPHLVWYLPSFDDPSATGGDGRGSGDEAEEGSGFISLIPQGWIWGTLQLAFAAVLAAVWRARRLGPLITERLPVVIRASESTEGRARLYRRTNARERAAAVLRSAARSRLSSLVGLPSRDADSPEALIPALAARLGTTGTGHSSLLFGPAPADDAALVLLTNQLDALEREVRAS
ncbi:DUF4350 domain-containing protein [Streptomyces sp. NPDC048590]|uniref:DUF4350 domain-containing protein n=1 Tax=Streptomyces sp. NPDC048590 TaxID=3365574 RepID=UPI003722EFF0